MFNYLNDSVRWYILKNIVNGSKVTNFLSSFLGSLYGLPSDEGCDKIKAKCLERFENIKERSGTISPYNNIQEWCIFTPKLSYDYSSNKKKWIKELLSESLKKIKYDRPLSVEDCVIVDVIDRHGSYFSSFHTDMEWALFPGSDGFQVWYLVYNKEKSRHGNMFIHNNPTYDHICTPSFIKIDGEKIKLVKNDVLTHKTTCDNFDLEKGNFNYLDIADKDCLLMTKNVLHSSDMRLTNKEDRYAINFRVVFRNKDGSINFNNSAENAFVYKRSHHKLKNGKLYNVGLFDLTCLN